MRKMTQQLQAWQGEFGNAYSERNQREEKRIQAKTRAFAEILSTIPGTDLKTILEVGANMGINIEALKRLTDAHIQAVEPNQKARQSMKEHHVLPSDAIHEGEAQNLPFDRGIFDLVYTSGVLIHIAPEDLEKAYHELYRVSRRYLLSIELFSQNPEKISYGGHDDLLFKRDFGKMWLDPFPSLKPVSYGFFWKPVTGIDGATWWLFEK